MSFIAIQEENSLYILNPDCDLSDTWTWDCQHLNVDFEEGYGAPYICDRYTMDVDFAEVSTSVCQDCGEQLDGD